MITYLVDTENVNLSKYDLTNLKESDKIVFFYTDKSARIEYDDLKYILSKGVSLDFVKCYTGNNALDFQLVSYLGFLLHSISSKDDEYIILSRDKGYEAVCMFWKDKEYKVSRIEEVDLVVHDTSIEDTNVDYSTIDGLEELTIEDKKMINELMDLYRLEMNDLHINLTSNEFLELNNVYKLLIRVFGEIEGREIYIKLRPRLKRLGNQLMLKFSDINAI